MSNLTFFFHLGLGSVSLQTCLYNSDINKHKIQMKSRHQHYVNVVIWFADFLFCFPQTIFLRMKESCPLSL